MFTPARSKTDMSWIKKQSDRIHLDEGFRITCVKDNLSSKISNSSTNNSQNWSRQSETIRSSVGGQLNWGNDRAPVPTNHLGRIEGQPGGSRTPIRNIF